MPAKTSTKKSRQILEVAKMVLKNHDLGSACPETSPGLDHFRPGTLDSYPEAKTTATHTGVWSTPTGAGKLPVIRESVHPAASVHHRVVVLPGGVEDVQLPQ